MPTGPQADGTTTQADWLSASEQDAWRAYIRLSPDQLTMVTTSFTPVLNRLVRVRDRD